MVKKYKLDAFDSLVAKDDGYLVYYDDYQKLEAENEKLRQALEEIYDWHVETHEDAYEMKQVAKAALDKQEK